MDEKSNDKVPLTTTKIIDFHLYFVYSSLTEASRRIVDMDAGWVGSKSENVEKALVFKGFFDKSRGARVRQENEQTSEPGPAEPGPGSNVY